MKYLIILSLLAVTACSPAPNEIPADFNTEFTF